MYGMQRWLGAVCAELAAAGAVMAELLGHDLASFCHEIYSIS